MMSQSCFARFTQNASQLARYQQRQAYLPVLSPGHQRIPIPKTDSFGWQEREEKRLSCSQEVVDGVCGTGFFLTLLERQPVF